jgi:hypothetical protein
MEGIEHNTDINISILMGYEDSMTLFALKGTVKSIGAWEARMTCAWLCLPFVLSLFSLHMQARCMQTDGSLQRLDQHKKEPTPFLGIEFSCLQDINEIVPRQHLCLVRLT